IGSLSLSNSTVTGNTAPDGAGILNAGTMTMNADTVNNNTASTFGIGGGILNFGKMTIINSTVAGNVAFLGGGIYNSGVLMVSNSTVASNAVKSGGDAGGIDTNGIGNQLDLLNTIVFKPNSGAAREKDVLGAINLAQGNLFGSVTGGIVGGGELGGNKFNSNPLLGALQNNGGPTATMALLAGSPAIGAGAGTSLIA